MKAHPVLQARSRGYATMAVVSSVSLLIISMLAFNIIGNLRSIDSQASAQVKQDYSQKEDAILTALIHIVPNKAIGAMQRYSANTPDKYTWDTIFEEAMNLANAEQAISPALLNSLDLGAAISANSGDTTFGSVADLVKAPASTHDGTTSRVNGGNWWEYNLLGSPRIGPKLPAALQLSYSDYLLDKKYPIISHDKKYINWYTKGLGLSADLFPLYNLVQYPDVKFGYKRPGEYFVAKRNWWAFSLTFGESDQELTGIPPVTKDYVLSIYEVPSQIPLSGDALLKVGQFADGTAWENVSLDGSVYAESLETDGTVTLTSGAISARKDVTINATTSVAGRTVSAGFDAMGQREARVASGTNGTVSDSDFYDASIGGNVGKVAFISINRGTDSLTLSSDGNRSERISPTGWNQYSRAAPQAQMTLQIRQVSSAGNQTPTQIRFRYRNSSNGVESITYTRGHNWPTEHQTGGNTFPFQTDELDNTRKALVIHMDRLPAFISAQANSGGVALNNSLYIYNSTYNNEVAVPSIPALETDTAVTLRGGEDLTPFTAGFSLVSRYRTYIGDSLNTVPATVPHNAGLPSGSIFYPPL
ncbi:MAG: hypothetical protein GXX91_06115, partial [Verrucomicrobiaceae bacterium]|nr:hypothetical protein [Verrucomicrobiaceae bacterium]